MARLGPDSDRVKLRSMLRQIRLDLGMTQSDLAYTLGVRQEWVSRYEVGVRSLDVIEVQYIAAALSMSLGEVLIKAGLESEWPH